MLHKHRIWHVQDIADPNKLAELLTRHTWTCCTGFRYSGYLYLNDSCSEDSAQEYAIIKEETGQQVESITFSWCSLEEAGKYIRQISAGYYDQDADAWKTSIDLKTQIDENPDHRCPLCM